MIDFYSTKLNHMLSTINHTFGQVYHLPARVSPLHRFAAWTGLQQEHRLLWFAITLVGHGCLLTPLTVALVMLTGLNFTMYMAAFSAMTMTLIVNLAAMPTKITIPVLALSLLIHLTIIITACTTAFLS